jgi:hypothetical protein
MSYINARDRSLRLALLSNFLLSELLVSRTREDYRLWLISPWITNFSLAVPEHGDVSTLVDTAEPRPRLFDVLRQIAINGGDIAILVRAERKPDRVERFIAPLQTLVSDSHIAIRQSADLHAKIYAGQCGVLYGSLNLTRSGVKRNLEFGAYASDARTVARLRAEAESLFETGRELQR